MFKHKSLGNMKRTSEMSSPISYDLLLDTLRTSLEGLPETEGVGLPLLAICTAFDDLNALSIGRKLDEETLTSLFLGHLGSSIRHAGCIWPSGHGSGIGMGLRWLHYSRPAENTFGSDFALLIAMPGQDERYRLGVFQAKRCDGSAVNLKRPPKWDLDESPDVNGAPPAASQADTTNRNNELKATREKEADAQLERYLGWLRKTDRVLTDGELLELEEQQLCKTWQLTKLVILALRLRHRFKRPAAASVHYVLWPEQVGKPVTYAPVAHARLGNPVDSHDRAGKPVAQQDPKSGKALGSRTQHLDAPQTELRKLLMTWLTEDGGSDNALSVKEAADACEMITRCVGSVAIVDLRSSGPALTLDSVIGLATPVTALPAYDHPIKGSKNTHG